MKRFAKFAMLIFLWASLAATTYVIEENGREVGRWEESDGKDEVRKIDSEAEKKAPSAKIRMEPLDGPGYAAEATKTTGGELAVWKVSGRVLDLFRLTPVARVAITFQGGPAVTVKTDGSGAFRAQLAQLESGSYSIVVTVPPDYETRVHVKTKGSFHSMPYGQRLTLKDQVPTTDIVGISGHTLDMEIGLVPRALTEKERLDYELALIGQSP